MRVEKPGIMTKAATKNQLKNELDNLKLKQ